MSDVRVTVWNEFRHEKSDEAVRKVYPDGMHEAIAKSLRLHPGLAVKTAWLDQPENGLTEEILAETDVLLWWGHLAHGDVEDATVDRVQARVLEGMGLIVSHGGGPYEHLSDLFSYEGLCLALHDQPDLVSAVAGRVGALMLGFYEHLVDLDNLIVVFPGDDMGFRTATLIRPDDLRALTLPWHARFARLAHEHGKLYFLHSCGNVFSIMPDLLDTVGIDGKHSYEDAILPADRFQERYGGRVAVLGGVDVDVLSRGSLDDVRRRTRWLIDTCGPRGRFAIGSGNSIPSYIPLANYLAMLEEALR